MPISLKNMRGCASPASTAICNSATDHRSMVRRSAAGTPRLRYTRSNGNATFSSEYFSRRKSSADVCGYRRLLPPRSNTPSFNEDLPLQPVPVNRPDWDRSGALVKLRSTDESNPRSGFNERVILTSSQPPTKSSRQIVVLRVSLHCRGCESKLRKHLSKMQGVTSFSIDLEAKKVTVIGDITPAVVLTSIAKVKNAQFWPSTLPS